MNVFEVTKPGTWLDYEDEEWSWRVGGLLDHLIGQFLEANAALNLFAACRASDSSLFDRGAWERDRQRRTAIRAQVEQELGSSASLEVWERIHFETEVRFKREQWAANRIPREFQHRQPFIYARAFLYALDAFDKLLTVISAEPGVPPELEALRGRLGEQFPDLRGVRNSNQHLEDRVRGLGAGKYPKPLVLQPIANGLASAPNGALALNCLNGSKYGSTMADGHYGEVDVSAESMQMLQNLLLEVLQSFSWQGPKQHLPSV